MSISYEVFIKHAEKVTKNAPEIRPVLKGVKHLENGEAVVTDSHRLYIAKGVHSRTDGAVSSISGKTIEGNYPDVSRLVPDGSTAKQQIQIGVNELLKATDIIASVGTIAQNAMVEGTKDKSKPPVLDLIEDAACYTNFQVKINYSLSPIRFEEPICVNAIYLLDAIKLFKAIGCQTVTLNFYGKMRPFTLENEDKDLLILILPIRKY